MYYIMGDRNRTDHLCSFIFPLLFLTKSKRILLKSDSIISLVHKELCSEEDLVLLYFLNIAISNVSATGLAFSKRNSSFILFLLLMFTLYCDNIVSSWCNGQHYSYSKFYPLLPEYSLITSELTLHYP